MIKLFLQSYPEHDDRTIEVKPTIFPDKTSQVWQLPEFVFYDNYKVRTIVWEFENEAELMHVMQLGDLIKRETEKHEDFYNQTWHILNLYIPYLPYARQDKEISNSSTFALTTFLNLLTHGLNPFDNISVLDAHNSSIVSSFGIENVMPTEQIKFAINAVKPDYIVFPDKGASLRGYNVQGLKTIVMDKVRNQQTGEITGLKIPAPLDVEGAKLLIVDDLADAGGTFIEATKLLKELDAKEVSLYTTHGLYTKGTKVLFDAGISRLFDKNGEVK